MCQIGYFSVHLALKHNNNNKRKDVALIGSVFFLLKTNRGVIGLTVMEKQIKAPDSLRDITLGQYQNYLKQAKHLKGDDLAQLNVSVFCNLNIESVRYIRLQDIREISEDINTLFAMDSKLYPVVKLDGKEFGFLNDMENMSFGEYIDLDKYINDWEDMHKAMTVMYRPVTKRQKERYIIEEYKGSTLYAEDMKGLPLEVALGSMVFFYSLGNELLRHSLTYSVQEIAKELITAQPHSSIESGDGTAVFLHSLTETIKKLKTPLEAVSCLHSHFLTFSKEKATSKRV